MATLLSVNVGLPKDVAWQGHTVYTGIWKHSVDGAQMVGRLNIDGDGQGDLNGHGGEQRAALVYHIESYRSAGCRRVPRAYRRVTRTDSTPSRASRLTGVAADER